MPAMAARRCADRRQTFHKRLRHGRPTVSRLRFLLQKRKPTREEKKEKIGRQISRIVTTNVITLDDRRRITKDKGNPGFALEFQRTSMAARQRAVAVTATDQPESDQENQPHFSGRHSRWKNESLAAPRGPFEGLRVSSDKTQISYVGARVDGPAPHDLFAQSLSGGAPRNLSSAPLIAS